MEFCAFGSLQAFPPTWFCIAEWVGSLGLRKLKPKTIKAHITALRSACIDRGYSDLSVFNEPLLQREINGIKRMNDDGEKRERKAITRDILLRILKSFDISIRKDAILHVAFGLTFADFLRIDEFIWFNADRTPEFSK